jgi:hypothetical protein
VIPLYVRFVVIDFVLNPKKDQSRTGNADCQPENVEEAVDFVLQQIAKRCMEKRAEHSELTRDVK